MKTNQTLFRGLSMTALSLMLLFSLTALSQEKTQQVTASLTALCVGGCDKRGERVSMSDGEFCCSRDQSKLQRALEAVKGVVKVALKQDSRKVSIDYLPGRLNLTALVKAADKAGFDIIL